ncbi:MAG: S8 family serine peptidase [Gemmatimonadetes bacterium]|nr:S8 family serine peptidase [Gemmatimonadota bacterium]
MAALAMAFLAGCARPQRLATPASLPGPSTARDSSPAISVPEPLPEKNEPILPPEQAFLAGMMPLRPTGVDSFRLQRPTFDGRGVIIGVLDSGMDPGLSGFRTTTTNQPKLLDLRDFSGEGNISLQPVSPSPTGSITVGTHRLEGFGRVARLAEAPYYAGIFRELPLGRVPAADLNANGRNTDEFPVIVAKSTTGWFAMTDADGDGSLDNDVPLYDYAVSMQTFTYARPSGQDAPRAQALAVNVSDDGNRPILAFVFDNSGHGSHVAGIAAGHNLFGIEGFDGVAPGAQLLGIKISNNARGGISVTGSMLRGMNYAADFAERRGLPLILNMSFGVGNELEGGAAIDSLVNEFALKHPGVLFVISAGNDGPGLSTVGFPGSADLALTVCAVFPGVFAQPPDAETPVPADVMGWWSARGGELAKPDVCAPGVAYSNIPPWHVGEEISGGTSMAAPQIAGLAALLQSALSQQGGPLARAVDLKRAITAAARPLPGVTRIDQGTGVPNVGNAYRWLRSAHQAGVYHVQALADGGNQSRATGAFRRSGLASAADTIQRFVISSVGGQPAARLLLKSDASWLHTPASLDLHGGPETIALTYDAAQLRTPGLYVGTVRATSATDTLAGPMLALVNTIAVPLPANEPFKIRETLPPGLLARYFLNVPPGAGGLTARLSVSDARSSATLYLFEPDGMPHRGGGTVEAGGKDSGTVVLRVNAEDLVAGVYEVVVQAPPNEPTGYTLGLAVPPVAVASSKTPGQVVVRNLSAAPVSTRIEIEDEGAVRDTTVVGSGSLPATVRVRSPVWADELVIDVKFDRAFWNVVTDFGLTVFDSSGQQVSRNPMNYAFTRQVVRLDSMHRGRPLEIELFPAFAHLRPEPNWNARLRIAFLRPTPRRLGPSRPALAIDPGSAGSLSTGMPDSAFAALPAGFRPLVRVTAAAEGGASSVRREAW